MALSATPAAVPVTPDVRPDVRAGVRPAFLLLSTSLLTHRVLGHSSLLDTLGGEAAVRVWTMSAAGSAALERDDVRVEDFPRVKPFREFPYNYLRRFNEFAWDERLRIPSRQSIARWTRHYTPAIRALKAPAWALARTGRTQAFEAWLERLLLSYPRSPEAAERLDRLAPSVVMTMGPFQFEQPAVMAEAKRRGVPTIAFIPSWDNISTKNRMVFTYDGYMVWSEWSKRELHETYPHSRTVPVYVVGAPQFDVFFQDRFHQSREAFCRSQRLRPDAPIILHAIGSPNFIREHPAALDMAERVVRGDFGDVQLLVRPHPIHDRREFAPLFERFGSRVVVQRTGHADTPLAQRAQGVPEIVEWVNTFRHADVVINLGSTVAIDAAIFDRPVINIDYDPEPGRRNEQLVKDLNHLWVHYKPIAESGGMWLAENADEVAAGVRAYLADPGLHRERRRWMAEYVCGFLDGRCGERMARALIDFARLAGRSARESRS
jgi:hypothetical protein